MSDRNVILKDREGNNCYPKTPITNIIGYSPGISDTRHIYYGQSEPGQTKSDFEDIQINDLYINTSSDRDFIFYRARSFYTPGSQPTKVAWDPYGLYVIKSGEPPTTDSGWSSTFGGNSPGARKGFLWCDSTTGDIYELLNTEPPFEWRCLTDNYSKSELDTMIAAFQPDIDEKADRIENPIKITADGNTISLEDSADIKIPEIIIYGKSTQNGTPTIDNPVNISDVSTVNIQLSDDIDTQTCTFFQTLRGIPVSSGGNYTDNNGQEWICDTIERYADGTGKLIQRVVSITLDGSENWTDYTSPIVYINVRSLISATSNLIDSITQAETTLFTLTNDVKAYATTINDNNNSYMLKGNRLYFSPTVNGQRLNATQFSQYLSSNNAVFECCLETPIETPLTAERLAQLDLSTYYPTTTVFVYPDTKITYVADTKNYFDKKIEQIQNAIISNGGNV